MPPTLLTHFKQYVKIINKHGLENKQPINLDYYDFLAPTTVLPLVSLVFNQDKTIKEHKNPKVNNHLLSLLGLKKHKQTTLPFRAIDQDKDNSTELTKDFLNIMKYPKQNENALKFIFHELITNVYDHSNFNKGFVLGQNFPNVLQADFCFMDNGISIPGSLRNFGYEFSNDCEAILQAINGLSTKDDGRGYVERGTGLNSTVNIVTKGGNGEFLIASNKGLLDINKRRIIAMEIPENYINGTFISLRVSSSKKIDIYDYLAHSKYKITKNIALFK